MTCRICGNQISPIESVMEKNRQTLSYADCNYQCVPCGVGYSNGQDESARTMIHACHLDNLPKGPEGLRTDLENCLANAANVQNRSNKRNKFAFSTSEDALTWSVFWYLAHTNQLASALGDENSDSATLFLWGCPVNNDPSSVQSKLHVIQVDELGETPNSKSEPDVIVETDTRLFLLNQNSDHPTLVILTIKTGTNICVRGKRRVSSARVKRKSNRRGWRS